MEENNKGKFEYITVLDFERGIVFQYRVPEFISDLDNDYCEEYITEKGHNLSNCEWMVHDDSKIWADHSVGQVIMKEYH